MELKWSSYGQIVFLLWIQYRGTARELNFQGKLIAPTCHLAPFGIPIIFCLHKHNEEELLCTLSFKNNASPGEKVRVVVGREIDHVKHEFLGFDATKSPLLLSRLNL